MQTNKQIEMFYTVFKIPTREITFILNKKLKEFFKTAQGYVSRKIPFIHFNCFSTSFKSCLLNFIFLSCRTIFSCEFISLYIYIYICFEIHFLVHRHFKKVKVINIRPLIDIKIEFLNASIIADFYLTLTISK